MKRKPLKTFGIIEQTTTLVLAVLYARVSSDRQEKDGFSIPAQKEFLREYAKSKGIIIVNEFIDVKTATIAGRIQFGNMLKYLRKHPEVLLVLVEKVDRLYRNSENEVALAKLGRDIHFVKETGCIPSVLALQRNFCIRSESQWQRITAKTSRRKQSRG